MGAFVQKALDHEKNTMKKHWKKYQNSAKIIQEFIDKKWEKNLTLQEASDLIIKTSTTSFDSSIEIHANLNVDPKHADQIVRWVIVLPHWTGKTIKVAAFVSEENKDAAIKAWADIAWADDLVEAVSKWKIDFDVAVATPDVMKSLWKIARTLWQKWLMPNPKAWTVTPNFEKAIMELKKWRVEFKTDKTWIIHVGIWKVSFWWKKAFENLKAIISAIVEKKPSVIKTSYIKSLSISTSMGPAINLDINDAYSSSK